MWEQGEELFKKLNELVGHFVEFMNEAIGIHKAEASSNWIIDKEKVGKLVPGAIVEDQVLVLDSIGANLHHRAVLGTATRPTIYPDDGTLLVGDMLVLEVPEEEVSVVFGCDLDVAVI